MMMKGDLQAGMSKKLQKSPKKQFLNLNAVVYREKR